MKEINKNEIYAHLGSFLRNRGIELKEGSYSQTIQKGCSIVADAINLGQRGVAVAKTEIDDKVEKMRQVIHEKTAPRTSTKTTASAPPPPRAKTNVRKAAPVRPTAKASAKKKSR